MRDPCTACADSAVCDVSGCPKIVLKPCETPEGCEFSEFCMGGALCEMVRPELGRLDLGAGEAQDFAEFMASARG